MNVLEQFDNFILSNNIVNQGDKVLLAVSGGKDSMLMAWLFIKAGFRVEIAHCNFHLRGEESDGDMALVVKFAQDFAIPIHIKDFDTSVYSKTNKVSIQMAARELRYAWFEELRQAQECQVVAVAQHKNDSVETVLFNLARGTGLKGLVGIQQKRKHIIRPLLFLTAPEIASLVAKHHIPYRDDSSNFSTKYARNKIRLDIIPEFEKLNPAFISVMEENMQRFHESIDVLEDFVANKREKLFTQKGEYTWEIVKEAIQQEKLGLIYLLFEPFHFSKAVLEDMILSLDKESGRVFESDEYIILSDRNRLILQKKSTSISDAVILGVQVERWQWNKSFFDTIWTDDCSIELDSNVAKIDSEKLQFPMTIRSWVEGDTFQPLGMRGKKKLSDFFIQRKVNLFDKKEVPILVNGNGEIVWIVGFQLDDRYKITQNTKKVLKLVFHK